jgi:hypothetical protein
LAGGETWRAIGLWRAIARFGAARKPFAVNGAVDIDFSLIRANKLGARFNRPAEPPSQSPDRKYITTFLVDIYDMISLYRRKGFLAEIYYHFISGIYENTRDPISHVNKQSRETPLRVETKLPSLCNLAETADDRSALLDDTQRPQGDNLS